MVQLQGSGAAVAAAAAARAAASSSALASRRLGGRGSLGTRLTAAPVRGAGGTAIVPAGASKAAKSASKTAMPGGGGAKSSKARQVEEKELLSAVKEGNVERVRELLEGGANAQGVIEPVGQNLAFYAAGVPVSKTGEASSSSSSSSASSSSSRPPGSTASPAAGSVARSAWPSPSTALLQLLTQCGVDPTITDSMVQTPLFYAAREGNVDSCLFLIERRCDPDHVDANAQSPLFYAARYGHPKCAELLIDWNSAPDRPDRHGQSPLFFAAHFGHKDLMRLLLKHGADVRRTDTVGQTCLFRASESCTDVLLDAGCDISHRDYSGRTALFLAAESGDAPRLRLLVSRGAQPDAMDSTGATCLFHGARHGHLEACMVIVEDFGLDVMHRDHAGRIARQAADVYHHKPVSQYLERCAGAAPAPGQPGATRSAAKLKKQPKARGVKREPPPTAAARGPRSASGGGAIDAAAAAAVVALAANTPQRGVQAAADAAVAAFGVGGGAADSSTLARALFAAVSLGDVSEVRSVFAARGDPETVLIPRGQNLVFLGAARETDACEVCQLLVQRQVNPRVVDTQLQQTPLFFAVRALTPRARPPRVAEKAAGDAACARFLLSERCSPDHVDLHGQTPLFYAVKREAPDCAEALIEAKASVNRQDVMRQTACFFAAQANSLDNLRALIRARADVGCRDNSGATALFRVTARSAALLLLESNCSANQRDNSGHTPLFVAASNGAGAVLRALLAASGDVSAEDVAGEPCLFHAARGRDPVEMCRILITEFGADPNHRNKRGETVPDTIRKLQGVSAFPALTQVRKVLDLFKRLGTKAGQKIRPVGAEQLKLQRPLPSQPPPQQPPPQPPQQPPQQPTQPQPPQPPQTRAAALGQAAAAAAMKGSKRPRAASPEKVQERPPPKAHRRKYTWVFDDPRSPGRTLEPGTQAYAAAVRALCEQCPWLAGWAPRDTPQE